MANVSRLVCNKLGWTKPSGIDCKNQDGFHGLELEATHGFGFEEWLFRGFNFIDSNGDKCYLGYVESFRQDQNLNGPYNPLFLSTKLNVNGVGVCAQNTKRLIGKISGCERLSIQDIAIINNGFNGGTFQLMRNELEDAMIGDQRQAGALQKFDDHLNDNNVFNIKFSMGYCFPVPLNHLKWDYLNYHHGFIQLLPNNFTISEVDINEVNEYIALNGGNIPQILPPL